MARKRKPIEEIEVVSSESCVVVRPDCFGSKTSICREELCPCYSECTSGGSSEERLEGDSDV